MGIDAIRNYLMARGDEVNDEINVMTEHLTAAIADRRAINRALQALGPEEGAT